MAVAQRRGTKSTRRAVAAKPTRLRLAQAESGIEINPEDGVVVPESEAAPLERRGGDRVKAKGQGVATFIEPDGRLWLTRVTLVDRSGGGLGVRCPVRVAPGASFRCSVGGQVEAGLVAHTRGRGGAYRVGLRLERRMAA